MGDVATQTDADRLGSLRNPTVTAPSATDKTFGSPAITNPTNNPALANYLAQAEQQRMVSDKQAGTTELAQLMEQRDTTGGRVGSLSELLSSPEQLELPVRQQGVGVGATGYGAFTGPQMQPSNPETVATNLAAQISDKKRKEDEIRRLLMQLVQSRQPAIIAPQPQQPPAYLQGPTSGY